MGIKDRNRNLISVSPKMLSVEARFVREYAKQFYRELKFCLKLWCDFSRYSPYYYNSKGEGKCLCEIEYPTIEMAMLWGNHVMKELSENPQFRLIILRAHEKKIGYHTKDFFESDPFSRIVIDDEMQNLLMVQLKMLFKWDPNHK